MCQRSPSGCGSGLDTWSGSSNTSTAVSNDKPAWRGLPWPYRDPTSNALSLRGSSYKYDVTGTWCQDSRRAQLCRKYARDCDWWHARNARFACETSKGNMIDNPDQVELLIARLRQSLPLFATVTPEVAAIIRERSPTAADPQRRYRVTESTMPATASFRRHDAR